MKFSKQAILARFHKMPVIRFEDQQLTSFAGVIVFVALFQRLDLKARLKQCFQHLKGFPIFGPHRIVLVVIVHLLLGFRRLRDRGLLPRRPLGGSGCWGYVVYPMWPPFLVHWALWIERVSSRCARFLQRWWSRAWSGNSWPA